MAVEEHAVRLDRAQKIGLFRYQLIQEAANPELSTRTRGRMVRAMAARTHIDPFGTPVQISRDTLDRWIRQLRRGGFDALVPAPRQVGPKTPAEVIETALALKRENPERTAAQVRRILRAQRGWSPGERTLQRWFVEHELVNSISKAVEVFGRFEADRPNELWTGDALHGPVVSGRKTYLFAFIDDHSRAIVGHRFGYAEDTIRLAMALRPALATRGVPERIYVDNGSAFVDTWLLRACAVLGIKLTHSTPGRPQGRGKIERFFKTVRDQFLVEIASADESAPGRYQAADLLELNRLFSAWVETEYHQRIHSETKEEPLARYLDGGPPPLPSPGELAEAFRWEEHRRVRKTATVELLGNVYEVDPVLVGRRVDLVFDPFDLSQIDVRLKGQSFGLAVPHRITRHAHPKARPEALPVSQPAPTGITYAQLLDEARTAQLAARINYAALTSAAAPPGQLAQAPGGVGATSMSEGDDS